MPFTKDDTILEGMDWRSAQVLSSVHWNSQAEQNPLCLANQRKLFFSALEGLNVEPHECIMIGDDVRDDVEGALKAGFQGILVRTGKYRSGDEGRSSILPTAVCDSFVEAVDYILKKAQN